MMQNDAIVIVGMARTAMGGFQGSLSGQSASELGAVGVSGVKSSEDAQIAKAGIAAIGL